MLPPTQTFHIVPRLPSALEPLHEIVYNLWWSWEPAARSLFRQIDLERWEQCNHNPLRMLQLCRQSRFEELARDETFVRELQRVYGCFRAYLERPDTYARQRRLAQPAAGSAPAASRPAGAASAGAPASAPAGAAPDPRGDLVAYFSAEFGFHESVPNYSGGLGILSGDHCKSASDLDLNFCAVGLLYRHGYFKQQINREGLQEAVQLNQNFYDLPVREIPVAGRPDEHLKIRVEMPGREVIAKVWRLDVGRIHLYLLDTDVAENSPEDRAITSQLYGGDHEMRIRQEIVLGMGGPRALAALGLAPAVYHLNEGHAAFLTLERIRTFVREDHLSFHGALQIVAAASVFTTHTPVPAGNDAFSRELMQRYFGGYPGQVGIDFDYFFNLGQPRAHRAETFSMTILALRTCRQANGVSQLHGEVSKGLWKDVWPGVPEAEVPIDAITNGIHTKTWTAPEFMALYSRYLGPDWEDRLTDREFWRGVIDIPDEVLWQTHQDLKLRLIHFVRERVRRQRQRHGESPAQLRQVNDLLNPDILTVGFARRFATYKRGNLLLGQPERLLEMINHPEHPVQFIFAGKAHPRDEGGKRIIQEVYQFARRPEFANRVVFLEDYDAYIGRRMYQGVDLWLNNPLRPLEASGTSGMKTPPNGGLNLSVLDGWWCEGYNGKNGWPIGAELKEGATEVQNEVDVESLFHVLETQVVPLYYAKPDGRLPIAWLQLMRESIRSVLPVFNTHRMVQEYQEKLYERAAAGYRVLSEKKGAHAAELSRWKDKVRLDWHQVRVSDVHLVSPRQLPIHVGDPLAVSAQVCLGALDPGEVRVEAYLGHTQDGGIVEPTTVALSCEKKLEEPGCYLYRGHLPSAESGTYGVNVRVVPTHPLLMQGHELRLISWAS